MSRVEHVDRAAASTFLSKAEEFLDSAREALARSNWNATGMNAIHAGISAVDAYLAHAHGIRSSSPDHRQAAELLRDVGGSEVSKQANTLERLVAKKTRVEYDARLMSAQEAREALTRAERLVAWAREFLGR